MSQSNETALQSHAIVLQIVNPSGEVVASETISMSELAQYRKATGSPISALLENMFNGAMNKAVYGPGGPGEEDAKNLGVRKPGENPFN